MHQSVSTELKVSTIGFVGSRMKRIDNAGVEQLVGAAPNDGLQLVAQTLTVTPATDTIVVGGTVQLKAVMTDQKGNDTDVTHVCKWVSANAAVASVSENGLVTGVSSGGPVGITGEIIGGAGAVSDSAAITVS